MRFGSKVLPGFRKDHTDRNRTSPVAFTGNKFEFRSVGSEDSIAGCNIVLNTIVAQALSEYADRLEGASDFDAALSDLIHDEVVAHKRILFNGNGYGEEWVEEAEKRGLLNLRSTPDALAQFTVPKNMEEFIRNGVYTETEIMARQEILYENYYKTINIEAQTLAMMARRNIMGAALKFEKSLADTVIAKKSASAAVSTAIEEKQLGRMSDLVVKLSERLEKLSVDMAKEDEITDVVELANYHRNTIEESMHSVREVVDEMETIIPLDIWPYPTYGQILYSVR
jgi:glutamine synthetase